MRSIERLAYLTALKKSLDEEIKRVREEADSEYEELYYEHGVKSRDVVVDGVKVGTFSLEMRGVDYVITDKDAFDDWMLCQGLADIRESVRPEYAKMAVDLLKEAVGGVAICEETVYAKDWKKRMEVVDGRACLAGTDHPVDGLAWVEDEPKGTKFALRDPGHVISALRKLPAGEVAGFLGAGDGE